MKLNVRELCFFGLLGALMYASKAILATVPNVHLVGVFIVAVTAVYRQKAIWPIYVFVMLSGLLDGFGIWWFSYLYIWLPLWAAVMLLPRDMKPWVRAIVYMAICSLHGFLYGLMYLPVQALVSGLCGSKLLAWYIAGLPYDLIHGVSNFFCGLLICPIINVLNKIKRHER